MTSQNIKRCWFHPLFFQSEFLKYSNILANQKFAYSFAVTCEALPEGNNTRSAVEDLAGVVVGTSYTYECLDGYKPSSDGLVTTCLITGKWSLQTPECEGKYAFTYIA